MYNTVMIEFYPYFTLDGSVGLFNKEFNDIYHSAKGALTESIEKFILPIDIKDLSKKQKINVLDICYGIGYNTKSFLELIYKMNKKKLEYNKYTNKIHGNKIFKKNIEATYIDNIINTNNYSIYINNIFPEININAVDTDKFLTCLAPFIKTGENNIDFKNQKLNFDYSKIYKYLSESTNMPIIETSDLINFLILENNLKNLPEILEDITLSDTLQDTNFAQYFDSKLYGIFKCYHNNMTNYKVRRYKNSFLHNIYYRHVSKRLKSDLKSFKMDNINFKLHNIDARQFIKNDKALYDYIFLDAFSPTKCPCLWTYEFFKELYSHLSDDGILLTYSKSASIRNAMIEVGFYIGNIYNEREKTFTGTIASKDRSLIKYSLSNYELGLLETKSGIYYKDYTLNDSNELIIKRRDNEMKTSEKLSSTQYKKLQK